MKRPQETEMSDPHYRDPRLDPRPLREEEIRSTRLSELNSSNAMWGWVAGAVVLALVLIFVFARGQSTDTASNAVPTSPPASTTGMAPKSSPAPLAAQPAKPAPSTTGQNSAK
jgi:hypothetical protein